MMSTENCLVKAIYSFKGKNNDELCFKKGDIITVTQREEGGWWEGTLGETTGWFPSNYVTEHKGILITLLFCNYCAHTCYMFEDSSFLSNYFF